MFIATLFVISQTQKPLRYSSVDKWVNLVYLYDEILFSTKKK